MDHYQTLGVAKNATPDEIKKAYRKLASQNHPDKGGNTAKFQEIQTAYDILSDSDKRQQYDNPQSQFGNFHGGFQEGFPRGFADFFNQFNQRQHNRSKIYSCTIAVSLEQVALGSSENVHIQTPTGPRIFQINIPKGVETNQQIRYEGILEDGWLQVRFVVHPHPKFERHGLDLHTRWPVSVFDLILGTTITVDTITGKTLEVTIKPHFNPTSKIRLQGYGLETPNGSGDQYVLITPTIPDKISPELLELLERERTIN